MIRLRRTIETGLRHPLAGPFLILLLALVLAFVALHTVEHGVEGLLFSCVVLAAVALRLVVVLGRSRRITPPRGPLPGRAPPRRLGRLVPARPQILRSLPLRL